jgi:hypothetical protein
MGNLPFITKNNIMNNFDLTKYLAEGRLFESFNMDFLTKTYDGDEDLDNDYEDFDNALDGIVSNVPNSIWDGERVRLNSYLINGDESEGLTGWDIIQRMVSDLTYIGWYDDITDYTKENNPNLDDDEIENIGRKLEDDIWDSLKMFAQKYNLSSPKYLAEGRLFEGASIEGVLDTPQDVADFLKSRGEAEDILDDILDVEGGVLYGEQFLNSNSWDASNWENDPEWEEFRTDFFNVGKPLTKIDVLIDILGNSLSYNWYADEGRLEDDRTDAEYEASDVDEDEYVPDDWEEQQDAAFSLMAIKAKEKYGIDGIYN